MSPLDPAVEAFFEHALAVAKGNLLKDNHLHPLAFILASRLPPQLEPSLIQVPNGQEEGGRSVICVPLVYGGQGLLGFVSFLSEDPAGTDAILRRVRELGAQLGMPEEEVTAAVLRVFGQMTGLTDGKDIAAAFLEKLCRVTEAEAIVKIDEGYRATEPAKDGESAEEADARLAGRSLADDPTAEECLMAALETRRHVRWVLIPFERTERDTGAVKGFGTPVDTTIAKESGEVAGRFVGLIEAPQ